MKNSLNKNDFYNFLSEAFPQVSNLFEIRNLTPGNVSLEMSINYEHLRPGNTIWTYNVSISRCKFLFINFI